MVKAVLIIGVGNPLRGDDAAGHVVCEKIEAISLADITTLKVHQLQTELLEEMMSYRKVLIVDAAVGIKEVSVNKVKDSQSGFASSHHAPAGVLKSLAMKLYNIDIDMYTCAIPALDFAVGKGLTAEAKFYVDAAIEKIKQWLG